MRHLKPYKLFESLVEDVTFIRMSHSDMLDGKEEGWFEPVERRMIGSQIVNDSLVKYGFPDKERCVHFMSESSYDFGYSGIYGKNLFQVIIDDHSKLGWSFVVPINDWFYKGSNSLRNARKGGNELVLSVDETGYSELRIDLETGENINESIKCLLDCEAIGFGTIEDLKRSKNYGNFKLYVWTEDKVYLKKYKK